MGLELAQTFREAAEQSRKMAEAWEALAAAEERAMQAEATLRAYFPQWATLHKHDLMLNVQQYLEEKGLRPTA